MNDIDHEAAPLRLAVMGAGSWGTTLASLAAQGESAGATTILWAREPEVPMPSTSSTPTRSSCPQSPRRLRAGSGPTEALDLLMGRQPRPEPDHLTAG